MCARPLSPRHAQPDWMGGGLVSRQMMHAPLSAAIKIVVRRGSLDFRILDGDTCEKGAVPGPGLVCPVRSSRRGLLQSLA